MGLAVHTLPPRAAPLRMGGPAHQRSCSTTARRVEVCKLRRGGADKPHIRCAAYNPAQLLHTLVKVCSSAQQYTAVHTPSQRQVGGPANQRSSSHHCPQGGRLWSWQVAGLFVQAGKPANPSAAAVPPAGLPSWMQ